MPGVGFPRFGREKTGPAGACLRPRGDDRAERRSRQPRARHAFGLFNTDGRVPGADILQPLGRNDTVLGAVTFS